MSKLSSEIAGIVVRVVLPGLDTPPWSVRVPHFSDLSDIHERFQQLEPERFESVEGPRIDGCYLVSFQLEDVEPGAMEQETERLRQLSEQVIAEMCGLKPELDGLDQAASPAPAAETSTEMPTVEP